ncbi:hypothetical protein BDV36DRAFT_292344 [Aspergillus pseudocaelatus]|uniref:Uncharacterized protein n=1 Tax=Aspergillus pseudocaelatus TaxID=1825620 RepID=A0ABQ6WWI8_9EURO|nr:hypothetical protein BDV36DRAFT_292344 [Aspergillus pseudocaelatus]
MSAERETPPPPANQANTDDQVKIDLALTAFRNEVQSHIGFSNDLKLAHSIGHAVYTDGPAIAVITQRELQAQRDRHLAITLSADDPELRNSPLGTMHSQSHEVQITKDLLSGEGRFDRDSGEDKGGPSQTYAERQKKAMGKLSHPNLPCCTCFENFQSSDIIRLHCGDLYCTQ